MNLAAMLKVAPQGGGGANAFLAFATDSATRKVLESVAQEHGWPPEFVHEGTVSGAVRMMADGLAPQRLVIDIEGVEDVIAAIDELAEVCEPGITVVAVGNQNDVNLYRQMIEAGVADYLLKPVEAQALNDALFTVHEEPEPVFETPGCSMTVVIGARGGVGASTIAVNTAWLIAHEIKQSVALVDLDIQFGSISLALDLEPGRGLREAVENPGRIDSLFLERAMVKESENLAVLSAEEPLDQGFRFHEQAVETLFGEMNGKFKNIIIDMPRSTMSLHQSLLEKCEHVVIVSDMSIAGVRDVTRIKKLVTDVAPNSSVSIVCNRVGQKTPMSKADFERGAEVKVTQTIPEDTKSATMAMNSGKPLAQVAQRSKLTDELRKLGTRITGEGAGAGKDPVWRRLIGRK